MRAFRRDVALQYFGILPDKFSFTTTITVAMLCDEFDVVFIPIDYHKRKGKSKIVPWDFFNFTTMVLRLSMLFNPLKVFIPTAFGCLIIGFGKGVLDIVVALESAQRWFMPALLSRAVISNTALIFLMAGLQILLIGMVADGIIRKLGGRAQGKLRSYVIDAEEGERGRSEGEAGDSEDDGEMNRVGPS